MGSVDILVGVDELTSNLETTFSIVSFISGHTNFDVDKYVNNGTS